MTAAFTSVVIVLLAAASGASAAASGPARRALPAIANAGGPAYLVKDIATSYRVNVPSSGYGLSGPTASGGFVYFVGNDSASGQQLWRTDGTPSGTEMVASLETATSPNDFSYLTDAGGILFFSDSHNLWRSDGSSTGTTRVKTFPQDVWATDVTACAGIVYFVVFDVDAADSRFSLWRSDGTAAGTVPVRSFSSVSSLVAVGDSLFFVADDGISGSEIWKTDGTPGGTSMVTDLCPGSCSSSFDRLTSSGGLLYFVLEPGSGGPPDGLFVSDGTAAGTMSLTTTATSIGSLTDVNGTLFFTATDVGPLGMELWKSHGTPGTTMPVKDIRPGSGSSDPTFLTNVAGTLYFTADDGVHGRELWKSDGSDPGTVMVLDLDPDPSGLGPQSLAAVGGRLFFFADDEVHGYELWTSDGTAGGTTLAKDICPGTCRGAVQEGTALGASYLIFGGDEGLGPSFWVSDGTAPGTLPLGHLANGSSGIGSIFASGEAVYFGVFDNIEAGTWRSDGTPAGTVKMTSDPAVEIVEAAGTVFFATRNLQQGTWSLERPDGASGTQVLVTGLFSLHSLTALNGRLLFVGETLNEGEELWTSDGTPGGTHLLVDLQPGATSSSPTSLVRVENEVFFQAYAPPDTGLWKTDGTVAGTVLVHAPLLASEIVEVGGIAYFAGDDGFRTGEGAGQELWRSDGTSGGTFLLKDMSPGPGGSLLYSLTNVGGRLFYVAYTSDSQPELWTSDGTTAGTHMVKDIAPGQAGSYPGLLRDVGGTLLFFASDGVHGSELWRSDGTESGTVMVADIYAGRDSSVQADPQFAGTAAASGGILYFGASTASSGHELWRTDGTTAGTVLVQDIAPGPSSSNPDLIAFAGSLAFFTADDGVHGSELWAMSLVTPSLSIGDGVAYEGGTGTTPLSLPVTLWPPTGQTVSVAYATHDGSAHAGLDYVATSGTLTLAPGQTQAVINVPVMSDAVTEPDEFFLVDLASPTNAAVGNGEGVGTIRDGLAPNTDLAITKTDGQLTAAPGQTVTYSIVVTNNGPDAALGAVVTDMVAPTLMGVTWTCASPNGGSCTAAGAGSINDTVGLPAGATVTYTLTGTINATAAGTVSNTASVAATGGASDPDSSNNSATDTDNLVPVNNTPSSAKDVLVGSTSVGWIGPSLDAQSWYRYRVEAGRSYCVEVDNGRSDVSIRDSVLNVYGAYGGAGPTFFLGHNDDIADEPGGPLLSRVCYIAGASEDNLASVTGGASGTAGGFRIRMVETTLFCPWFFSGDGFESFILIKNTTGTSHLANVTLTSAAGMTLGSPQAANVPANGSYNLQLSAPPPNGFGLASVSGGVLIAHDGAPGSLMANITSVSFASGVSFDTPAGSRPDFR